MISLTSTSAGCPIAYEIAWAMASAGWSPPGRRASSPARRARPLPLEDRQPGGDPVQQAADVDVDHPVPLLDQQRVQPRQRHHAGVVDDHVDPAVPPHGLLGERDHVHAVGDVQAACVDAAARLLDLLRERLQALLAAGADDHLVAFASQAQRGGLADAAAGAGDQNDLGVTHVRPSSRVSGTRHRPTCSVGFEYGGYSEADRSRSVTAGRSTSAVRLPSRARACSDRLPGSA